ncbi:hypothetical protein QBC34DRAFT_384226 [Podospora aff. communis PSN243]|uniref:Uncharacterized protein n=1 Tax=Podospora aff. communis PSN243 TaxID=3040156 RepID=A0AAV9GBG5_9PEZI|nr:hypothetical protein QBC34DRAFT_384226 [Podospora aff. communis PSN243]
MADHQHLADVESASFLPKEHESNQRISEDNDVFPHPRTKKPWSWRSLVQLLSYIFLLIISFGLGRYSSSPSSQPPTETPPLSQSLIGHVPHKPTVFHPSPHYNHDPFGPSTPPNSPWHALIPPGKGHIRVPNPSLYNLTGGFPLPSPSKPQAEDPQAEESNPQSEEEYTLSVFHQLHCLAAMKSRMVRLQDWFDGKSDKEYLRFALGEEHVSGEHVEHCFEYVRQGIICAGDTTLEGGRVVGGRVVRGVDGWGVEHWCRDWDWIFGWAGGEGVRSGDGEGIE